VTFYRVLAKIYTICPLALPQILSKAQREIENESTLKNEK
jgi:hypothetical protein